MHVVSFCWANISWGFTKFSPLQSGQQTSKANKFIQGESVNGGIKSMNSYMIIYGSFLTYLKWGVITPNHPLVMNDHDLVLQPMWLGDPPWLKKPRIKCLWHRPTRWDPRCRSGSCVGQQWGFEQILPSSHLQWHSYGKCPAYIHS